MLCVSATHHVVFLPLNVRLCVPCDCCLTSQGKIASLEGIGCLGTLHDVRLGELCVVCTKGRESLLESDCDLVVCTRKCSLVRSINNQADALR